MSGKNRRASPTQCDMLIAFQYIFKLWHIVVIPHSLLTTPHPHTYTEHRNWLNGKGNNFVRHPHFIKVGVLSLISKKTWKDEAQGCFPSCQWPPFPKHIPTVLVCLEEQQWKAEYSCFYLSKPLSCLSDTRKEYVAHVDNMNLSRDIAGW